MSNDKMNAKQILLYVNKLLKPCEICSRSYSGKDEQHITIKCIRCMDTTQNWTKYILQTHYEHAQVEDEGKASS